jgi:hypothetical protein
MHYFGHTIDNGVKFLYFVRSLLPSKSPILTKYWWVPLHVVLRRSLWIILNATFTGSLAGKKSALYYLFFIYVQLLKQMPMVWFLYLPSFCYLCLLLLFVQKKEFLINVKRMD